MTLVDRHSSCILAWRVDWERSEVLLQAMVDEAPQAKFYYSDLSPISIRAGTLQTHAR